MNIKKINTPEVEPKFQGGIQVGETAYITKYATTTGIIEEVVESAHDGYRENPTWMVRVPGDMNLYYQGKDLFKTRKEAVEASLKLVERKMVSIDKSREKMWSLKLKLCAEFAELDTD